MPHKDELTHGPLTGTCRHLCVDMQRLFAEDTDWFTPWMAHVLPNARFTRFVPAERPGEGFGTWKQYYERWASMTLERLGREMIDLVPELACFAPPAEIVDKRVYSPWFDTDLHERLQGRGVDTLVVTGGESDVCVLGTVLGAIDRGYRVVLATDALCSSSDETYDAALAVYHRRSGQQVETATTGLVLRHWPAVQP